VSAAGWNCCPFCREAIKQWNLGIEDTTCPACGRRIWLFGFQSEIWFFRTEAELIQMMLLMDEQGLWSEFGADSLDLVEIRMELEERLQMSK
jgi:hypothetical protein